MSVLSLRGPAGCSIEFTSLMKPDHPVPTVLCSQKRQTNERSIEMNRPGEFKVLLVAKAVSDYLRSDGLPSENDLNIWETLLDQAVAEIRDEHRTSEGK